MWADERAQARARARARARMMRRRRRSVLMLCLLLLTTGGWMWRAGRDGAPSAEAGGTAHRVAGGSPARGRSAPPAADAVTSAGSAGGAAGAGGAGGAGTGPAGTFAGGGSGRLSVVRGSGRVAGTGPLRRYLVEVEDGLGSASTARGFAAFVERTLADPRSWTHGGALSLQRVDSGPVAFRVTLAAPRTVDRYCAPLDTNSYTSCWDGRGRAMLNQARWATGVSWYADELGTYRRYMVNHEVGHALGHHHAYCPGAGALAPTMQQQTLGMQGCRRNAWPYP